MLYSSNICVDNISQKSAFIMITIETDHEVMAMMIHVVSYVNLNDIARRMENLMRVTAPLINGEI